MKKLKKLFIIISILIFILILLLNQKVIADYDVPSVEGIEYSEDFKNWLQLPEKQKSEVLQPRVYNALATTFNSKSPLYKARLLGISASATYNLKNIIPSNLQIRNQMDTYSCWAFAALSSLETNLAMANYNRKKSDANSKVFDYSERHMEYSTSRNFKDGQQNELGYNRVAGTGGNWNYAISYLTNGSGAIPEEEMEFENNTDEIELSQIQGKTLATRVLDSVEFADYNAEENSGSKSQIMSQIKQHIQSYGSVFASIHGNASSELGFSCYDNANSAKYCNDSGLHRADHAVSIVGWDDGFSKDKFTENCRPTSDGAWIIRNSWGENISCSLSELKQAIIQSARDQGNYTLQYSDITTEFLQQHGYTVQGNMVYYEVGDAGFMYVSYEDCNISKNLYGIEKASDIIDYDYMYQYDTYYPAMTVKFKPTSYIGTVYDRKNASGTEYLTQVGIYAPETYTCKVFVNPTGESMEKSSLKEITLKEGPTETFNSGYHTLEFATPLQLTGSKFAVVLEIKSTQEKASIALETRLDGYQQFDYVQVESNKCFMGTTDNLETCEWKDMGKLKDWVSTLPNGDNTIKAYTIKKPYDESLKSIEIETPPQKTTYYEGEEFQKDGMTIKAIYNSATKPFEILADNAYSITDGNSLTKDKTYVTISYNDKTVQQKIAVQENELTSIEIAHQPEKTDYIEGESFNSTGMVVNAVYKNGTKTPITEYSIENGTNLTNGQTEVKISYQGKTATVTISVTPNALENIFISTQPSKKDYIEGQDFDPNGMVVKGHYKNGSEPTIAEYTVENGKKLTVGQDHVTIKYQEKTVDQGITVRAKQITQIEISTQPQKLKYVQGKDSLSLEGGVLTVTYDNGTSENIDMTSQDVVPGEFSNATIGPVTVTITYKGHTTQLHVEVVAEPVAPKTVTGISVSKKPDKLEYIKDKENELQLAGGTLKVEYSDGTNTTIQMTDTGVHASGFKNDTVGKVTITITYQEQTTTFQIDIINEPVVEKTVTGISISKKPTKLKYIKGKDTELNLEGGELTVTYSDQSTKKISMTAGGVSTSGFSTQTLGEITITVTYENQTAEFKVEIIEEQVAPKTVTGISIAQPPTKLTYIKGKENLELAGGSIKVTYSDGSNQNIPMNSEGVSISGFSNDVAGTVNVTVTYQSKTTQFQVQIIDEQVIEKTVTKISVKNLPTKLTYIKDKEELNLAGGTIEVTYSDGTSQELQMASSGIAVNGFNNETVGTVVIVLTYQEKSAQFEVKIVEEEAENSNIDNLGCEVQKIQAYYFTSNSQKNYVLVDIEISGILKSSGNDSLEYYYYLSPNANEQNVQDWTEITEEQNDNTKLKFNVDSRKMSNYAEIANEDTLYLYIKEVAVRGGNQSVVISKPIKLESDVGVEAYVDNVRREDLEQSEPGSDNPDKDNTTAEGEMPQTGIMSMIVVLIAIAGLTIFCYIRYHKLKDVK